LRPPLRERVEWLLNVVRKRALSAQERACEFALPPLVDPTDSIGRVDGPWADAGEEDYEELAPTFARVLLRGPDGERWALRCGIERAAPHRFRYVSRWPAPEGVVTRLATQADAEALTDLERRSPVLDGEVRRTYNREGDWFAQIRLMDEALPIVAEVDGRIVGVMADAVHLARIDGRDFRLLYRMRLRVDPATRGRKLLPALNGAAVDLRLAGVDDGWGFDSEDMLVAAGNERMLAMTQPGTKNSVRDRTWLTPVERLLIDCRTVADRAAGRPASAADAARIAALLTSGRGREVGFPETDAAAVERRLTRAPAAYGWDDVTLDDGAVLGVWDERLVIAIEDATGREEQRCAIALDYGAAPGHEERLVALVRSACAQLATTGRTHLVLFTSPGAALRGALAPLATRVEPFRRFLRVPEPADAGARGVYLDPIYF
jgi:hypothetical protein